MNKKQKALIILKILKKEYKKYKTPLSTSINEKTQDSFKVLIVTILSARSRDIQTEKISNELFNYADTPEKLANLDINRLKEILRPIGFYNEKSKRVKQASKYLLDNFKGKVPNNFEDLIKIPGVGRKTANIVLAEVHGKPAIGVDTHCMTVANRLGLVKGRNPLKVEKVLEKLFPKKEWKNINRSLVVHGQNICKPIKPLCYKCPIEEYCNYKYKNLLLP